jgi:radical SAM superfamily enzyme YgiQ (UPF0313 family)
MARVVFVQNLLYEYHGLKILSACLQAAGHRVDVVIGATAAGIARRAARLGPDLVGLYHATGDDDLVAGAARALRREGFRGLIVSGGPQPTLDPAAALAAGVDYACVGEADLALPELLDRTGGGRRPERGRGLRNWAYRDGGRFVRPALHPLIEDLDALPPPDERLYAGHAALARSSVRAFMGSRGCPHSCAFCCNRAFKELYAGEGRYWRALSPERFVEQIARARAERPFRTAALMDDDLLADGRWAAAFLELYAARVAVPFTALVRVGNLTEELARRLVAARCHEVIFGVESGDEEYRRRILAKRITDAEIRDAAALLRRVGLRFATVNMLALPGETPELTWKTVRFNQELAPAQSISHIYQPLPGTALGEYAVAGGYVAAEALRALPSSSMHRSVLSQPGVAYATNAHQLFYLLVRHPRLAAAARPLLRLPPNPVFRWIHRASYFDFHRRFYRKGAWETARFGLSCLAGLRLGRGRFAR